MDAEAVKLFKRWDELEVVLDDNSVDYDTWEKARKEVRQIQRRLNSMAFQGIHGHVPDQQISSIFSLLAEIKAALQERERLGVSGE